ncbi:MAG: LysR family transcriptional regulator [Pseudomonadota bacterium]
MRIRMDWRAVKFDWNRARAFLVTAEEGSLSAAARALGMTQPTLGRQVAALEVELGVALFERIGRGLTLTPTGRDLVEHVRAMGDAATRVSLGATGRSQSIQGTVRITASEVTSAFVLPPILMALRAAHPGISVVVVATNALRDLRRREADIAIRHAQPTDQNLIARKLPPGTARLFASHDYLARHGPFDAPEALALADLIGFDENDLYLEGLNAFGVPATASSFVFASASHLVQWEMTKRGAGIGVMNAEVGHATAEVAEAAPWLAPFEYPVWLVAHRDLTTSRRVRLVYDWLAAALSRRSASRSASAAVKA